MDKGLQSLRRRRWSIALIAALGLLAWDAVVRGGRISSLSENYGVAVDAPRIDPASPTGYALERRSLVLPMLASDARHWIMQAQVAAARGEWRLRHVDYDNAPLGREVHWASPLRWWLLVLAHIESAATGTPLPLAVERAVLWANPIVFGLLLVGVVPLVALRFGGFAAALLALGLVTSFPFAISFYAGNVDHHGIAQALALLLVLLLVVGLGEKESARKWFTASGAVGGLGLWISAASLVPVLIGVGLGLLVNAWQRRGVGGGARPWRHWAVTGGITSLLAYLIEYAPAHLGWRLEVNHPLYAFAWFGAGELLWWIDRGFSGRPSPIRRGRDLAGWLLPALTVAGIPVLMAVAGTTVFWVRDPFLQALHANTIAEFQSLPAYLASRPADLATLAPLLPVAGLLGLAGWCWLRQRDPKSRTGLMIALGPALTMGALAVMQIRWWGLAYGLLLVAAVACFGDLKRAEFDTSPPRWWRWIAAMSILPGLVSAVRVIGQGGTATESDVFLLAERDVAHRLRLHAGADPLVVASTPNGTTSLLYHASARGLGTMYWENHDGLATAAALFAAPTAERAHELVRQTGVTHVVLFSWDGTEDHYVRLARGLPATAAVPADSFASGLRGGRLPAWLRQRPYRLPPHPALRGHEVRVFEVIEGQSSDEAAAHAAAFLIEMGRVEEAHELEPVLAQHRSSLVAAATLAGLQARRQDAPSFARSLARVRELLPHAAALPLEDGVRVTMVLAIGGRSDEAVAILQAALAKTDERALRRLTPGTVEDLLALVDALGVIFPNPALRQLTMELKPPG